MANKFLRVSVILELQDVPPELDPKVVAEAVGDEVVYMVESEAIDVTPGSADVNEVIVVDAKLDRVEFIT